MHPSFSKERNGEVQPNEIVSLKTSSRGLDQSPSVRQILIHRLVLTMANFPSQILDEDPWDSLLMPAEPHPSLYSTYTGNPLGEVFLLGAFND